MITPDAFFDTHQFKVFRHDVELDVVMRSGDSRMFVVRLRDHWSRELINLTGARLHFAVADSLTSPYYDSPIIEKSSVVNPDDLYVYDPVQGIVVFRLRTVDTLQLMPREYPYALSFVNSQGDAHAILTGKLKVRRSVGRLTGKLFYHKQSWTGVEVDGLRLDFALEAVPEASSTIVLFDGVVQTEGVDYIINGKVLRFVGEAPDAGELVEIIYPSIEP